MTLKLTWFYINLKYKEKSDLQIPNKFTLHISKTQNTQNYYMWDTQKKVNNHIYIIDLTQNYLTYTSYTNQNPSLNATTLYLQQFFFSS